MMAISSSQNPPYMFHLWCIMLIMSFATLFSNHAIVSAFSRQRAASAVSTRCRSGITSAQPASTILFRQLPQTPQSKSPSLMIRLLSASNDNNGGSGSSPPFQNHLDKIRRSSSSSPPANNLRNRFFALRHGQSLANVAGLIASNPDVACQRYGLSDEGKKQARKAGDQLVQDFLRSRSNDHRLRGIAIVASDLLRAKETAQIAADAINSHNSQQSSDSDNDNDSVTLYSDAIVIDTRLRERGFGDWDGGSDAHYHDVWKDDAKDPSHTLRGVESVWSVTDRATKCVLEWDETLATKAETEREEVTRAESGTISAPDSHLYWVVCVAHGDVLQILQTAFCARMDPSQHRSMEHLETATLRPLELT